MRSFIFVAALALAACVAPGAGVTTTSTLAAADAATSLIAGERLTLERTVREAAEEGQDSLIALTLRHSDGRRMRFEELNHAPTHMMAQAPGGPLAQIMGLFGEERPLLYAARPDGRSGTPFICAPEGPLYVGVYEAADGAVQIVGLRQPITFETRPDGVEEALPYSPDQVCARLSFRRS